MRSIRALAHAVAFVIVTIPIGVASAQTPPVSPRADDADGLGPETPGLARLRNAEPDRPALPRTVAEAAALESTPLPDGVDRDLATRLQMPAMPLRLTPRIAAQLARYRTDRTTRRGFASWLRRAGRYRVRIEAILASEGVPTELVWVVAAESGFDPNDLSSVGAVGLWQLMPDTARSYGLRVDAWVDERRDPERSTRAAAQLLRDLHSRFGAWDLALAAYNMGYGALLRTIRKYNTNDFERVASVEAGLPFETTTYVPRILAATIGAHNLETLGLADVTPDAALTWEDVSVVRSVPIDAIAHALGIETAALRALNPALAGSRTPPCDDVHPFVLHVPLAASSRARAWIDQYPSTDTHTYVVRHGETLDEIANRAGLASASALLSISGFTSTARIEPGTILLVPSTRASTAPCERPTIAIEPIANPPAGRRHVFYHVAPGETLREIATALAVSRDELVAWNALDPNARLQGGMWLQAYVPSTGVEAFTWDEHEVTVVRRGSEAFYEQVAASSGRERRRTTVREGDTMRSIAERYGLSLGSLARINHRSRHATLTPGEEIVVYAAPDASQPMEGSDAHDDGPTPPAPSSSSAPPPNETIVPCENAIQESSAAP